MLTIQEADGVRSLHFGTAAIQGAMRVAQPDAIELEYVQQMMMWLLFRENARHIVQLGLGAGALTKFCYRHLPSAYVTAVELDPAVAHACREHFFLPEDDERLQVLHMDAMDYVGDFSRRRSIDILQVDLYDARALAPVWGSSDFYAACASSLAADGIMTVNLFCDWPDHALNIQAMQASFEAVAWLPEVHDGNIVAIAFKRSPSIDFDTLQARAAQLRNTLDLPAEQWVDGLQQWMQGDLDPPGHPSTRNPR